EQLSSAPAAGFSRYPASIDLVLPSRVRRWLRTFGRALPRSLGASSRAKQRQNLSFSWWRLSLKDAHVAPSMIQTQPPLLAIKLNGLPQSPSSTPRLRLRS